jgi:ABC-2 type transport system permease protein
MAKTYERLITSPASLPAILMGDAAAGAGFGITLSLIPLMMGFLLAGSTVASMTYLLAGIVLGAAAFSGLGILLAARASSTPSEIMMLANLVRLPLIFVSGVFIPIADMPEWGQRVAPLSPLSYSADLIRAGLGGTAYFPTSVSIAALTAFTACFLFLAHVFHRRSQGVMK